MRLHLFLFVLALLAFSSCRKEEEAPTHTIQGSITDYINGTSLAGVRVNIQVQEITNGTFSTVFKDLATVSTNSSGNYSYTFEAPNAIEYKLELSLDNYRMAEELINPDDLVNNGSNTINLTMEPRSWFQVKINNVNPFNTNDRMYFNITSENPECPSCCDNLVASYEGDVVSETIICETYGNRFTAATWSVTKNGTNQIYRDSVFCTLGDTVSLTVHY